MGHGKIPAVQGEVFILQSRPETVWSQKEVKPVVEPRNSAMEHIVAGLMQERKSSSAGA